MFRAIVDYRVRGPAVPRRSFPFALPGFTREREAWFVDTASTSIAAMWIDGVLWLAGDVVCVGDRVLPPCDEAPPGCAPSPLRWSKLIPESGARALAIAGAAQVPASIDSDRNALLERMLDVPPAAKRGMLAQLWGKRAQPVEAAALVVDVVDDPAPDGLEGWLAGLRARAVDLSWAGNEGGPGLVQTFRRPVVDEPSVSAALLAHARGDPELTRLVGEYVDAWLEDSGEQALEVGRLMPDDPTRGWIEELELDAIASNIRGGASAWLDPGSSNARVAWRYVLPGEAILAALHRHVEQPAIVAVHSAPDESALAVHLIGGIDRVTGELVGFALQRVWT